MPDYLDNLPQQYQRILVERDEAIEQADTAYMRGFFDATLFLSLIIVALVGLYYFF
jgi:hypothetical protein